MGGKKLKCRWSHLGLINITLEFNYKIIISVFYCKWQKLQVYAHVQNNYGLCMYVCMPTVLESVSPSIRGNGNELDSFFFCHFFSVFPSFSSLSCWLAISCCWFYLYNCNKKINKDCIIVDSCQFGNSKRHYCRGQGLT